MGTISSSKILIFTPKLFNFSAKLRPMPPAPIIPHFLFNNSIGLLNVFYFLPKKKPIIAGKKSLETVKKSKFYSKKDFTIARKAFSEMKKAKWADALKTAKRARDKSIYNFIQWRHLLTKGNRASFYDYKTFIDKNEILISEKTGKIKLFNQTNGSIIEIKHNLSFIKDINSQGGLLEILYHDYHVYISYSEKRGEFKLYGPSSTSIAKAKFNRQKLNFDNIFRSEPPIRSPYHFGSRIAIKDNYLFASLGERGKGMIAQEADKHPGSIIRINLDGSVPKDNPHFTCLLYTSPSPRDRQKSRMPSSA